MIKIDTNPAISQTGRLSAFLKASDALGIEFRRAVIVAATSINESGGTFGVARTEDLVYPPECYPTRQILIAEEGNPAVGTKLRASWTDDPEIMDHLRENGWLNAAGNQLTAPFGITDTLTRPNIELAHMFEWLIDRRKTAALGAFSVGPTQMYMRQSAMAGGMPNASGGKPFTNRFFPQTIEQLWRFYTAASYEELWMNDLFGYLPTNVGYYPKPSFQVCGGNNGNDCIERYLQNHQTGTVDWTSSRFSNYASSYLKNVRFAWDIARSVGYRTDGRGDLGKPTQVV